MICFVITGNFGIPLKALSAPGIGSCKAILNGNIFTLENNFIKRTYKWNGGDLIGISILDKIEKHEFVLQGRTADSVFPGAGKAENGKLETQIVGATSISPGYLTAIVTFTAGGLNVKKEFRIYPDCPAIKCDLYLKGNVKKSWISPLENQADFVNVEDKSVFDKAVTAVPQLDNLSISGRHWKLTAVDFSDVTDYHNNLVKEDNIMLYSAENRLKGNLLILRDQMSKAGLFILKECPLSSAQLNYPGFDFSVKWGNIKTFGAGILPADLKEDEWTRCYGLVTGVGGRGEIGILTSLRRYQQDIRLHRTDRDEMVMMNTWGDRGQDKRVNEAFILKEIVRAKKMGISHFQIDDGWQCGRSANSAFKGGSFENIWANQRYWKPDSIKFPNGFKPIMELSKKLGIEICLWFNPSKDDGYSHWREDAGAMIGLFKQYGIRTFKIDGLQITNKKGEVNFRKTLDSVMTATKNEAVFNLDVTAGKRNGYHYFNEYGNIFLENRYTDWGNYYPHLVLRNLWQLSKYIPAQNLQIEFLNNSRNKDKYPANDPLAPSKIPFEYTFAVTMMAQPLAWMEATGLDDGAIKISTLIYKYLKVQADLHKGMIFPIGEEPSGSSWTGFQSISDNTGYLLIFRESNKLDSGTIATHLPPNRKITLTDVFSRQKINRKVVTGPHGSIRFKLSSPNSFALYRYQVN